MNLLSHADYFSPAHPTIRVFSDRLEFQNSGRFVIDPNDASQRMQSLPRNPTIIRMFRHAKISENGGYGIDKILTWKELTKREVVFKTDLLLSTIVFYRQDDSVQSVDDAVSLSSDQVPTKYRPSTDQVRTLLLSMADSYLGVPELMKRCGIKHRPTFRENYLLPALRDGVIERKDKDNIHNPNQQYRLTKLGNTWRINNSDRFL